MNSLTNVTLDLQAPNIAVVTGAKQNDLMSRKIACQLKDGPNAWTPPAGSAATIRYSKPDGTAGFYDTMEDETTPAYSVSGSVITIILCEQMLTVPGNVWVEINFYTSTEKLTTFYFLLEVQASVLSDNTIISSDYYNILTAQINAFLAAAVNPPIIDSVTKNWMLWDTETSQYVDSGYSSIGATGPAPALQSTAYQYANSSSGTTVPSSWSSTRPTPEQGKWSWTKTTLTFATGTTTYYTTAYQGIDGQGSPGTATPLGPASAGVVGTATAYSRQDHRHPLVVSDLVDLIYPVGSIYMSTVSASPAVLFGGTWTQIEDVFLLAAGSAHTAGETGGEEVHTLVEDELPSISGSFNICKAFGSNTNNTIPGRAGKFTSANADSTSQVGLSASSKSSYNLQRLTYSFGGDNAHNNMPPYLAVYVWKRTA